MYRKTVKLNGLVFRRIEKYSHRLLGYENIDLVIFKCTFNHQWYLRYIQKNEWFTKDEFAIVGPFNSFVDAINSFDLADYDRLSTTPEQ